jgi:hypothetical protein
MKANATDNWIRTNGLNCQTFDKLPVELVRAQKTAHTLLKLKQALLSVTEIGILKEYVQAMGHGAKRQKITQGQCFEVLNIGKAINRKVFKANKARQR